MMPVGRAMRLVAAAPPRSPPKSPVGSPRAPSREVKAPREISIVNPLRAAMLRSSAQSRTEIPLF